MSDNGETSERRAIDVLKLNDTLALSHVPRWSVVTTTRRQSVAEHSFRVAAIVQYLLSEPRYIDWDQSYKRQGVIRALIHDAAESKSGDISGPFKRLVKEWNKEETGTGDDPIAIIEDRVCPWLIEEPVTQEMAAIIKLADDIETYTFLKMYGQGSHAAYVTSRCHEKMMKSAKAAGWSEAYVDRTASHIINETGRN